MKQVYVIIDGYNMMGQSNHLSALAQEDLSEAREQLIVEISNYNALIKGEVICVFDAYDQEGNMSESYYHGVKIIYTKENETADSYIERWVYNHYNKHTTKIMVVTSDMSEQHAIFGTGAYRISSREMWRNITENEKTVKKTMASIDNTKPRTRIPLSEDVLTKFEKLRRGNPDS
ncbi:NYN domain-containing protein [Staphylococcus massiliensis]|uniref:NYN domain-containing protein n=2 Tax=Staphylococcus massiliensis TaxID=555791 RepID=K9B0W2_9STAP|nr:NYN domain-containing protein [Staphylococcus massiliensis]EKU47405.1 hypothetical protein C273_07522 [Staphylococcus massiliensis S46]MCG3401985.1 NYN domain-containing protein [Staphylococcus massiliensis]PNZ99125.1 hypothetical protein CD133_06985 [Staphylococcus massiliensis CCUG 55927]